MSGPAAGLSISTLPRFLCALHNLRSATAAQKLGFSTSCPTSVIASPSQSTPGYKIARTCASNFVPRTRLEQRPQTPWRRFQSTERSAEARTLSSPKTFRENKGKRGAQRDRVRKFEDRSPKAAPGEATADKPRKREPWQIQKDALREKFKEGWDPRKKLSPDAMEGVRQLHKSDPLKFTTPVLAEQFKVSAEAIRRILKSKWRADENVLKQKQERWERREGRIWNQMAELGLRPQREDFAQLSDVEGLKDKSGSELEPERPVRKGDE